MKVKELMELLSKVDPNRKIYVSSQGYNNCHTYDEETVLVDQDNFLVLSDSPYVEHYDIKYLDWQL